MKSILFGKNALLYLFLFSLTIRVVFVFFYGKNGFEYVSVKNDSAEYGVLMERALAGDFNFDLGRFVRAPFYPLLMASFKLLFGEYWQWILVATQIVLSSLVSVYILLIARYVFNNDRIATIAGLFAAIYLPTFYYVGAFSTEIVYLFCYVAGTYYFLAYQSTFKTNSLLKSALLFAVCYITRPEVLMYLPFLLLSCWHYTKNKRIYFWKACVLITLSIVLFSLPWGLYNLKKNGVYISSSNGSKYVFYLGNSEIGYVDEVNVPPFNSKEYKFSRGFANVAGAVYDSAIAMPQSQKQDFFLKMSWNWIKQNPGKWLEVKTNYLVKFFIPGISWNHHSFSSWLMSFLVSAPIYLLFFIGFGYVLLYDNGWKHAWFYGKFVSTLFFLVTFLFVQRFRVYSIEIFYLIYAAQGYEIVRKWVMSHKVYKAIGLPS